MKKEDFLRDYRGIVSNKNYDGIEVQIQMPNLPRPETIANPRDNFMEKLEYYISAYNENMELKSFTEIKITKVRGTHIMFSAT